MAGVSRETASIELKRLERKGLIHRRRLYVVRNLKKLEQEVNLYKKESDLPPSI